MFKRKSTKKSVCYKKFALLYEFLHATKKDFL